MKKLLIGFLLSLSCVCAVTAVGCKKDNQKVPDGSFTVDFVQGDGYTFLSDTKDGAVVKGGEKVSFSLDISVFYTGSPSVSVNDRVIAPDANNVYTVSVTDNLTIEVAGVKKDVSNMLGTGAFDDAFVVSKPIDLLYIAQQVNAGNYTYVTGSYVLANDIDCNGEELEVIGNFRTENAYFAGCFTSNSDAETGAMERYTISNFTINTHDTNYVGLFGLVQADPSVTSSGLLYGIQLDNFTINASITDPVSEDNCTIVCGSLVGYGIGANAYLCSATNGTINLYADDAYFSFAGGLMGYQQAINSSDYGEYPSEIAYANVDVDINVLKGATLYAGGISGFMITNYPLTAAYITNSYSTGSITGAMRAGGIAGGLGANTTVSNCYATGEIVATSSQAVSLLSEDMLEYGYAMAGGIVGYAENETIVNNCFYAGKTYADAVSGEKYEKANYIIGGGPESGTTDAASRKYIEWENYPNAETDDVSPYNIENITAYLGWETCNWIIEAGKYPTIQYEASEGAEAPKITRMYVTKNENGEWAPINVNNNDGVTDTLDIDTSGYLPMGMFNDMFSYYAADNANYRNYGIFLDKECTLRMPYCYLTTKSIEVYVAFADITPILGEYTLQFDGVASPVVLSLNNDGYAYYNDGTKKDQCIYYYDGEQIVINSARFTRYYLGPIEVDATDTTADQYFDMGRYSYYNYIANLNGDVLTLYDNFYFMKDNPIVATKTAFVGKYYIDGDNYEFYGASGCVDSLENGISKFTYTYDGEELLTLSYANGETTELNINDLQKYDNFKGTWAKNAVINKTIYFDGKGAWSYTHSGYSRNGYVSVDEIILEREGGEYDVVDDGNVLMLSNGWTVTFNADGFLEVDDGNSVQVYYNGYSYVGEWKDTANTVTLTLNGIGQSGRGEGTFVYADGSLFSFEYEPTEVDGYVALYIDGVLYGYFSFYRAYNAISAVLYNPLDLTADFTSFVLYPTDAFDGEWISNNEEFEDIEFNGKGFFSSMYGGGNSGNVTINGEKVRVAYTLQNSTMVGEFIYQGKVYTITYDEINNIVRLENAGVVTELQRKDKFAGNTFLTLDGKEFNFDGKSNLEKGGTFTSDGITYAYRMNGDEYTVFLEEEEIGNITETNACYLLTLNDTSYELYMSNGLMGDWAISGAFDLFKIGPTNKNGTINATFKGYDIILRYETHDVLSFSYTDDSNMPYFYYVFLLDDKGEELVISQQPMLIPGKYTICSKADQFFGTWTNARGDRSISFDGVQSQYANGTAKLERKNSDQPTYYYYSIKENGVLMWSQEALGGDYLYFKVEMTELGTAGAYELNGKALKYTEVDSLYLTLAKDSNGVTYEFDGMNLSDEQWGKLLVDGEAKYEYDIVSYNTGKTVTLTLIDIQTGEKLSATLDYSDNNNIRLIFETETA